MTPAGWQLDGVPVLVVGGSAHALGEVVRLREQGAHVTVVADELAPALDDLVDRGLVQRGADVTEPELVAESRLVVDARTPDERAGGPDVRRLAREAGVPAYGVSGQDAASPGESGGSVVLVGGGPGHPGLLTRDGYAELLAADVVVTDRLAPVSLLADLPGDVEVIDVSKIPRGRFTPQQEINAILVREARAGRRVVRLKGGDSFVFGRGFEEVEACREAGVPVTVVPGVTSAVSVPELAGIPVTHRGVVQGFTVVSGHAAPDDPRSTVDWAALARVGTTIVVLMGVETLPAIARTLLDAGRAPETPVACVMDGGLPSMRVARSTLGRLVDDGLPDGMKPPAVTVIGEVAALG
ncbi:uroporphyrinogen-III C-methyltransferase [Arsenicicoccus sp. oral taxon 190]|uniref:uroporphyrinogen-III C-methyltransferase n=1 Tax=Arsenicicoccus sp. oral taxon 190 TaxID=1658671 RepID=UPI00067A3326|nr:uroporphyrinogen-III C-methyltransferase [Arsenicicoccus sp. oral taxon 190]AKT52073.1 uroporphyrin-III methyltransferase [Arsenicicoccus sp. oral taxon 190]